MTVEGTWALSAFSPSGIADLFDFFLQGGDFCFQHRDFGGIVRLITCRIEQLLEFLNLAFSGVDLLLLLLIQGHSSVFPFVERWACRTIGRWNVVPADIAISRQTGWRQPPRRIFSVSVLAGIAMTDDGERFRQLLRSLLETGALRRLVFSRPVDRSEGATQKIVIRPVEVRQSTLLQWTHRIGTQERHENQSAPESLQAIDDIAGRVFQHVNVFATTGQWSVRFTRKGAVCCIRKRTRLMPAQQAKFRKLHTIENDS